MAFAPLGAELVGEGGMEVYDSNKTKVMRRCLKCGRKFFTDRCHRICRKCTKENYEVTPVLRYPLLRGGEYLFDDFEIE
jgi:hypothetical protein